MLRRQCRLWGHLAHPALCQAVDLNASHAADHAAQASCREGREAEEQGYVSVNPLARKDQNGVVEEAKGEKGESGSDEEAPVDGPREVCGSRCSSSRLWNCCTCCCWW